jgi:hypothetical protein
MHGEAHVGEGAKLMQSSLGEFYGLWGNEPQQLENS